MSDFYLERHIARVTVCIEMINEILPDLDGIINDKEHEIVQKLLLKWLAGLMNKRIQHEKLKKGNHNLN